jgi:hypothetical protein
MMKRKRKLVLLALGFILSLLHVGSYVWHGESTMPRTAFRQLNQNLYEGCVDFILVDPKLWQSLSSKQKRLILNEFGEPAVYTDIEDVPQHLCVYRSVTEKEREMVARYERTSRVSPDMLAEMKEEIESGKVLMGFNRGVKLNWIPDGQGLFWMESTARYWASGRGAENRSDLYIWFVFGWLRIWNYWHSVS